ncbi:hypothetical protein [Blautia hydrogenotrophica]|jgi:hypothetical protein|uniref:Uncharacterized protein n=1 Tax=Blautia hydrogenotrophica (strain DSM 10507 / JCM 14656 / S5a33) TaxID=476272 RepID=C0CR42_BLAHS|nr:hypothetical protein [Blautia hydrogenotrophica]SCI34609.1 Uncharacterised protein [uncultured Blautia sp.]DAU19201.1 MAG TPA: hypothetical protein [Caudoviricetes sp.]EEG47805.1 hypothetical protein RUMHYD_03355 [Blautia hydrogenotrophica DSM 10507]MCT6798130.1 hypothetical protein [Blautia hydrogenotrophica]WPX84183.1 hypothetical protein BLHYD_21930 [Blautia hydrogenotrophica DSM 10507]
MSQEFYTPLTPKFRGEINDSINSQLAELNTCERNTFVSIQEISLNVTKNLIRALPDGYPLRMKKD